MEDISRRSRDRRNKLTELNEELEKCQNELLSHRLEVGNDISIFRGNSSPVN